MAIIKLELAKKQCLTLVAPFALARLCTPTPG